MSFTDELDALDARIEALSADPTSIEAPVTRVLAPVLRGLGLGAQVEIHVEALEDLLSALADDHVDATAIVELRDKALAEHAASIESVERATLVRNRVLVSHAAWLRRVFEVLSRVLTDEGSPDHSAEEAAVAARGSVAAANRFRILQPLWFQDDPGESTRQDRIVSVEVGAIDRLVEVARNERRSLRRRRALLEAARQRLLEASAALSLPASDIEGRRAYIASEIVRIDRLQAAGLDPDIDLLHQARTALTRGALGPLHASLVALDEQARVAGDRRRAERTGRAMATYCRAIGYTGAELSSEAARRESVARSGMQQLGPEVVQHVDAAYERAKATADSVIQKLDVSTRERAYRSLQGPLVAETLAAALASDGAFEVGGSLSPVRAVEIELRPRRVSFPTARMELTAAHAPEDLVHAIIQDPRSLLIDLAAGRLLARTYVAADPEQVERTRLSGEVRVYVVDASGSMHGPRGRMRDAMLLSELVTMLRRLETYGRRARVVLFYRFFTLELTPAARVADRGSVLAAIDDVLGTLRGGGTDIQAALLASIAQIHAARAVDPDLGRAQIVLVTDGQSPVYEDEIQQARRGLEGFPIAISVIALGQENEALRMLVARQRARGERAFYHFISDQALATMMTGSIDAGCALHADPKGSLDWNELRSSLGALLDEVSNLDRAHDLESIERLEAERRACKELGLSGDHAHIEAVQRDLRNLERRFTRWFPRPPTTPVTATIDAIDSAPPSEDSDAAHVVLATVAEVVSTVGGSPIARRADAIELLERLLPDGGLTPERYCDVVTSPAPALVKALATVHEAVGVLDP